MTLVTRAFNAISEPRFGAEPARVRLSEKRERIYEALRKTLDPAEQELKRQWQVTLWTIEPHYHSVHFKIDTTTNPELNKPVFEQWFRELLKPIGEELFPDDKEGKWVFITYPPIKKESSNYTLNSPCCGNQCPGCLNTPGKNIWIG